MTEPVANLDELGKTEQERDDAFFWLDGLAAKQGATEGLLTKPEERLEEEPEWVKHAKDVTVQPPPVSEPVSEPPAPIDQTGTAMNETTFIFGAGLAGGFAYWAVAGWSAGFWKPVFARAALPALAGNPFNPPATT